MYINKMNVKSLYNMLHTGMRHTHSPGTHVQHEMASFRWSSWIINVNLFWFIFMQSSCFHAPNRVSSHSALQWYTVPHFKIFSSLLCIILFTNITVPKTHTPSQPQNVCHHSYHHKFARKIQWFMKSLNIHCKVVPVHFKASNQLHNLATIHLEKCPPHPLNMRRLGRH